MNEGDVFGYLTFTGQNDIDRFNKNGYRIAFAFFTCQCGNTKSYRVSNVKSGNTKSCGCLNKANPIYQTPTYNIWDSMIQRCYNPNHNSYSNYGGRGIIVCESWRNSFINFVQDMGEKPKGLWLERIDNNSMYCKENCKWDTPSNQIYNQRIRSDNKSGKTGVSWNEERQKWEVEISKEGLRIKLGRYSDLELAVLVREEAELKYYGYLKNK